MKKLLTLLSLSLLCLVVAVAHATTTNESAKPSVERGQYIVKAANCAGCHSFSAGLYAGGTPFGVAFSPNITPDKETGIGNYSFEDFDRAIRAGVSKKGFSLSVMMPPSYAQMTDADIRDLYEFMMKGIAPIKNDVKPVTADRPFVAERKVEPFVAAAGEDTVLARGRYLTEVHGHCGFCHSPRNEKGEESALWASEGKDFLAGGGVYNGWIPINLRNDHQEGMARRSVEDLTEFLLTGRNKVTAAFGPMTGIVTFSTQHLTKEDAIAMATFLKSLSPKYPSRKPFKEDPTVAKKLWNGDDSMVGGAVYVDSCATCHKTDGSGYARFFPELRGNPVVFSDNPISLINITLRGQTLPGVKAAPSDITMPPFGWRLSDQEIADVVTFVRTSWGNNATPVTAEEVAKVRGDKALFPDPKVFGSEDVKKLLDRQS